MSINLSYKVIIVVDKVSFYILIEKTEKKENLKDFTEIDGNQILSFEFFYLNAFI